MNDDLFEPLRLTKPTKPAEFGFSLEHLNDNGQPIVDERNKMADDMKALIDRFNSETEVNPMLITQILNFFARTGSYDTRSIVLLGKVLVRLGEKYLAQFDELNQKCQVIDYASKHPDFMAMVFGKFDSNIDDFLGEFFEPQTPPADDDLKIFE
jgi:hypothetical protein